MGVSRAFLPGAVVVLALACGSTEQDRSSGGSGGSGGTDAGTTPDSGTTDAAPDAAGCQLSPDTTGHAQAMAEAACKPHAGCCTQAGLGLDTDVCISTLGATIQQAIDAARCRGADYDAAGVTACINAIQTYSASCPMYFSGGSGLEWEITKRACAGLMKGTQQPGEPCDAHFECEQAPNTLTTCANSQCLRTVWSSEGSSCDPFAEPIETDCDELDGLRCQDDECVALSAIGEPCVNDFECVREGYCEGQTCAPRKPHGEACDGNCEYGLACKDGICAGALGDPCIGDDDCGSHACVQGVCVPDNLYVSAGNVSCN